MLATEHPYDDLAAYAVDALDRVERLPIDDHLACCPACRAELDLYLETLSWAIDDELPPPSVWDAILRRTVFPGVDAVGAGSGVATGPTAPAPVSPPAPSSPAPPPPAPPAPDAAPRRSDVTPLVRRPRHLRGPGRPGAPRRAILGALAAAAAVVVAVGVVPQLADRLGDDGPGGEVAGAPQGPILAGDGSEVAQVRVDDDGTYLEMTGGLAPAGPGKGYQFWSTGGASPVSLGLLGSDPDGEVRVTVPDGTTDVAISIEPVGGSATPTDIVGVGRLS
jgi:hypothetical protein